MDHYLFQRDKQWLDSVRVRMERSPRPLQKSYQCAPDIGYRPAPCVSPAPLPHPPAAWEIVFFTDCFTESLLAPLQLLPVISGTVEEALLRWLRAAELTCDRAALLVAQVRPTLIRIKSLKLQDI